MGIKHIWIVAPQGPRISLILWPFHGVLLGWSPGPLSTGGISTISIVHMKQVFAGNLPIKGITATMNLASLPLYKILQKTHREILYSSVPMENAFCFWTTAGGAEGFVLNAQVCSWGLWCQGRLWASCKLQLFLQSQSQICRPTPSNLTILIREQMRFRGAEFG